MLTDPLGAALAPVVAALEELRVLYYIGGSVASMTHGEYRQTADVDIVADLQPEHVAPFIARLSAAFYVDEEMIRREVGKGRSFNIMHLNTMFKVDVFPLKPRAYDQVAVSRRERHLVESEPPVEAYLSSPEDILLAKLEWFRMGGGASDRQWRDIKGLIKTQLFGLDFDYLEHWAQELKVADLLDKALDEAGLKD